MMNQAHQFLDALYSPMINDTLVNTGGAFDQYIICVYYACVSSCLCIHLCLEVLTIKCTICITTEQAIFKCQCFFFSFCFPGLPGNSDYFDHSPWFMTLHKSTPFCTVHVRRWHASFVLSGQQINFNC